MTLSLPKGVTKWQFAKDLYNETSEDNLFNGAAALAYYFFFALFPAMIFLLSLLPYLPIQNLHQAVMDFMQQVLPGDAAKAIEGVVAEVTLNTHNGLLSVGALLTIWAASSGVYAVMQQLNTTYDVRETRPFWKVRGIAVLLTIFMAVMIVGAFALIVFGGVLQNWLGNSLGLGDAILVFFAVLRWVIIATLLLGGFAIMYYFGPDVEQKFTFITPGALLGVIVLTATTLGFRYYVENFGNYAATYGSIGAVIILMLWLYISGTVILLGSEINALIEHYSPEGKNKGEHTEKPKNSLAHKSWGNQPSGAGPKPIPSSPHDNRQPPDWRQQQQQPSGAMQAIELALGIVGLALATRKKDSKLWS
jgi:membrane protein